MVSNSLKAEVGGLSPRTWRTKGRIATHLVNLAIADAGGSARPPVVDGGAESRWPDGTARHRREGRAARSGEGGKTAARERICVSANWVQSTQKVVNIPMGRCNLTS